MEGEGKRENSEKVRERKGEEKEKSKRGPKKGRGREKGGADGGYLAARGSGSGADLRGLGKASIPGAAARNARLRDFEGGEGGGREGEGGGQGREGGRRKGGKERERRK